jgi:hypothetical protein
MDKLLNELQKEYTLLIAAIPKPEVAEKIPRALCPLIKAIPGSSAPRSQVKERMRTALFDKVAQCIVVKTIIGGKIFPGNYPVSKLNDMVDSFY